MSIEWYKYLPIFSKNKDDFMKNIQKLPYDVVMHNILLYIPNNALSLTCRYKYITTHKLKELVPIHKTEKYIRTIIRQDLDFVFCTLLVENYNKWVSMTHYKYKLWTYNNYIEFLQYYCIENDSEKCIKCINKFIMDTSL